MGGSTQSKFIYSVPITEPKKGESAIYRNADYSKNLVTTPASGVQTVQEMYTYNFKNSPDKNFLGQRPRKIDNPQDLETHYEWETWSQVEDITKALGSALIHLKLVPRKQQFENYNLSFAAIYGKNSREWILTDIANSLYGITSVPIYDTLGEEATDYMFNQTELTTCFLTCNHLEGISKRINGGNVKHLRNLIVMDEWNLDNNNMNKLQSNEKITIHKFSDLIKIGRENLQPLPNLSPHDICLFSYTSGTTGLPKGAMISHSNLVSAAGGAEAVLPIDNPRHISYLPLAHVFERIVMMFVALKCGEYGIFNGDVLKIKEDLAILKPNMFPSVPRLFNKFYDKIQSGIRETTGCKATIAAKAISAKRANVESTGKYTHWLYDKIVFKKMKTVLGGNVKYLLSGSAPISTEVRQFLKIAFSCGFSEGYGQTEGIGGSFVSNPEDKEMGMVGGPLPHNEFKIIDVPEMKYFSTDKDEQGNLAPRGEILVRGANIIPGYYKNLEKTKEAIDSDGWLHSGDIGQILSHNGALRIIDRRKNIFKLSQGEYVAPDKLEQVYKTARGVADIFVYGDSLKSRLVAIINVDQDEMEKIISSNGYNKMDLQAFCNDQKVKEWYIQTLKDVQKNSGLKGFERISRVYLDPINFADHDLITTTFKLKRYNAKDHYKKIIEDLYVGLD